MTIFCRNILMKESEEVQLQQRSVQADKSSCSVYEVNQSKEATGSVTGCMTIKGEAFTTLVGHTQCVSAMVWPQRESIYSASWDHSIRKWDVEIGKKLTDLVKL
ncbi:hypothetical protein JHK87_043315 [Glycine soja]|nr:hypothetical protein JHK87_043315 [Glycine soja]